MTDKDIKNHFDSVGEFYIHLYHTRYFYVRSKYLFNKWFDDFMYYIDASNYYNKNGRLPTYG